MGVQEENIEVHEETPSSFVIFFCLFSSNLYFKSSFLVLSIINLCLWKNKS